jgi:hypothetical protein
MEVDTPIEAHVSKLDESIQGFCLKIIELEAHTIPGTPLEEREKMEKMMNTTVENIKSLETESSKLCEESTEVWSRLIEDVQLQEIGQKIQALQEKS